MGKECACGREECGQGTKKRRMSKSGWQRGKGVPEIGTKCSKAILLLWGPCSGSQVSMIGSGRGTVGKCAGPKHFPKWSKRPFWLQNGLIPNRILAFARPKWSILVHFGLKRSIFGTKMVHFSPFWPEEVHFGPFRSANRTLAIPNMR